MAVPVGLSAGIAAAALAVAVYAAFRLVTAWPWGRRLHYDINISHVFMGTAMAAMVVPTLGVLPAPAWEAIFGAEALWFVWATARFILAYSFVGKDDDKVHSAPHYATHAVMALSMLYVFIEGGAPASVHTSMAMATRPGGAGDTTLLSLFFVVFLLVSATCELDAMHQFARLGALSTTERPAMTTARVAAAGGLSSEGGEGPVLGAVHLGAPAPAAGTATAGRWLAPRLEAASHVAMCLVMAYMLVIMW
jgi:hypothetical protein